ncbi:MAG: hypothetical protein RIQ78_1153 [Bacteroidota bacterium]
MGIFQTVGISPCVLKKVITWEATLFDPKMGTFFLRGEQRSDCEKKLQQQPLAVHIVCSAQVVCDDLCRTALNMSAL